MHQAPRGQTRPPPGEWPAPVQVEAATVRFVVAGAPSLIVAPVAAHDGLDAATLQFLLQLSFQAFAAEEGEAMEVAKLVELEEQVAVKEQQMVEELERLVRLNDRTNLTRLLGRACEWALAGKNLLAMKGEEEAQRMFKKKKRWRTTSWRGRAPVLRVRYLGAMFPYPVLSLARTGR